MTTAAEKEELRRLAKDRISHFSRSTKNAKLTLTNCQEEAVFNENEKFAGDVQAFLRSNIEEKEFGPFANCSESEKWANGMIRFSEDGTTLEVHARYGLASTLVPMAGKIVAIS